MSALPPTHRSRASERCALEHLHFPPRPKVRRRGGPPSVRPHANPICSAHAAPRGRPPHRAPPGEGATRSPARRRAPLVHRLLRRRGRARLGQPRRGGEAARPRRAPRWLVSSQRAGRARLLLASDDRKRERARKLRLDRRRTVRPRATRRHPMLPDGASPPRRRAAGARRPRLLRRRRPRAQRSDLRRRRQGCAQRLPRRRDQPLQRHRSRRHLGGLLR